MRNFILKFKICILIIFSLAIFNARGTNYQWVGATSGWNSSLNWNQPLTGFPGAADNATIVTGTVFNPVLDMSRSVTNFTMTSGTLDLGGFTLTITGTATFNGGTITNGTLNITGATTTFAGTTFNASCTVSATSADVYFNGSVFNGTTNVTKTGAAADNSNGGNTFAGTTTIANSGSGNLRLANTTADTYSGNIIFTNTGTGGISPAYNGANAFNGNITVNSTSTGGINFGGGTGTSVLANTKVISVGGSGFSSGTLLLKSFTQTGATAQTLTLTGTGVLTVGPSAVFNGNVTFTTPQIYLNGGTYNGTATITKNGATHNLSNGGNTFVGASSIINTSTANIALANSSADIFTGNVTFTNSGTGGIFPSYTSGTTQFNGNIVVNNTAGLGVQFGFNGGLSTLATTKTISVGGTGFTTGTLLLKNFTQTGNTAQSLTLTGTGIITIGPASTFNGSVTIVTPQVYLNGATYNKPFTLTKNGATGNSSSGGNTFNDVVNMTVSSPASGDFLALGATTADIFNDNATFTTTSSFLYVGFSSAGNQFNGTTTFNNFGGAGAGLFSNSLSGASCAYNGNVIVNNTGGAWGVEFGFSPNTGSATLTSGKTISVGASGFSTGTLLFRNFTQLGGKPQTITLTGDAVLSIGSNTTFNGAATFTSPGLLLNGSTFGGNATFVKNGSSDDVSSGGNTFQGVTSFTNSGSGYVRLGNASPDIFNGATTFINSGTNYTAIGFNSAGNQFNSDVTLTNSGSGAANYLHISASAGSTMAFNGNIVVNNTNVNALSGVYIGGNGSATLATGKTITLGASGFSGGVLRMQSFTQNGATPQALTLSGTSLMQIGPSSTFNGSLDFKSPQVTMQSTTFNNIANVEKTGATSNNSLGGNIFNSTTSIKNSGSGDLLMANTSGDDFNGNATFLQTGTGILYPAYNNTNTFSGNVSTIGTSAPITFGSGTGIVTMDGSVSQSLDGDVANPPVINRLIMNKALNNLTLNVTTTIGNYLTLTNGRINSSASNLLIMSNSSTTSGASHASYVSGPVRKVGNQAFTFPVGSAGFYRPIGISAPSLATDHFTAEYFFINPETNYTRVRDVTVNDLSRCEYWNLDRTNGASNVTVTLSWENFATNGCSGVTSPAVTKVLGWNGSLWKDMSNGGTTGTAALGTVTAAAASTVYGPFTIGSSSPLPVEILSFSAESQKHSVKLIWKSAVEINLNHYSIEKSNDGKQFEEIGQVEAIGNGGKETDYSLIDNDPFNGSSYYRLKSVDQDGSFKYSEIIPVRFNDLDLFKVYPTQSSGIIWVKTPSTAGKFYNLEVSSLLGNVVYRSEINPGSYGLDVSGFPAGIYLIKLVGNGQSFITKIVKN